MRTIFLSIVAAAVLVPAALAVEPEAANPSQQCKALQATMKADFKAAYKTFGACVTTKTKQAAAERQSASQLCQAERDMAENDFKAANEGKSFNEKYGANAKDRNAFGKCVSGKAKAAGDARQSAELKAAKSCKLMRSQKSTDFAAAYGTGKNAYGKCVRALARAA